jgi:hypothetical protein
MRQLSAWLLLFALMPLAASAQQALRVTCEGATGSRVQYVDNPLSPAGQNKRLIVSNDGIDGLRLELTFRPDASDAVAVMTGNQNTEGRVTSLKLIKIRADQYISFLGIDDDGSANLLSYFPKVRRLVWSIHTDRILFVDSVALGKVFSLSCVESRR